jgi:hypothetical protein
LNIGYARVEEQTLPLHGSAIRRGRSRATTQQTTGGQRGSRFSIHGCEAAAAACP